MGQLRGTWPSGGCADTCMPAPMGASDSCACLAPQTPWATPILCPAPHVLEFPRTPTAPAAAAVRTLSGNNFPAKGSSGRLEGAENRP